METKFEQIQSLELGAEVLFILLECVCECVCVWLCVCMWIYVYIHTGPDV